VSAIAASLREPFVFSGQHSKNRRRRHGAPSTGLPRRRFVVAIQNHDQVGNRAAGDRLSTMLSPNALRLAAALLILSPYVPLLFMGEEYGETNPFQYFISHSDPSLVQSVREGRKSEFAAFGWGDDVPNPADEATFQRSKIDWSKATSGSHAQMLALYRDLLALRRDEPLLRPDNSSISVEHGDEGWITVVRESIDYYSGPGAWTSESMLAVFNCSDGELAVPVPGPREWGWTRRLSTESDEYGGTASIAESIDASPPDDGPKRLLDRPVRRVVRLPAWSAAVYTSVT
jgi:maltooligosyltrehalose trehalohydrolase